MKKLAAAVMAAVITVSAMVIPTTTASAAGVFDGAQRMESMEYYNVDLPNANEHKIFKIELAKNGTLTFRYRECNDSVKLHLYDEKAEKIATFEPITGYKQQNREYTVKALNKGTYYLDLFYHKSIYVSDLYYTFTPDQKPTISLKLTVTKGDTIQLGSVVENYDGKVTWETTKKSVATVSTNGKVTAKKKGTATIRAKLDSGEYVQIKVVVKNPTKK